MALYLVQHGKNLPKETNPDQPLSEDGRAEVQRIADVARGYGIKPERIEHSPKTRAAQTAQIFADSLGPRDGAHERSGIKALDDPAALAPELAPDQELMLVGHLPFLERLCSSLVTGQQEPAVFKFQNGGIVCLDIDPRTDRWIVTWALMPRIGPGGS
jgi:phosphohistidine phosphatase